MIGDCTCGNLRRLTRRVTARYDHALADCGLRITQYSLLSNLRPPAAATLSALAAALDMDRTTLTRNLAPLVDAGWVVLESGGRGRTRVARLTPAGAEKFREARRRWRSAQRELDDMLGRAEVKKLHSQIDDYLTRLRPLAGDPA